MWAAVNLLLCHICDSNPLSLHLDLLEAGPAIFIMFAISLWGFHSVNCVWVVRVSSV